MKNKATRIVDRLAERNSELKFKYLKVVFERNKLRDMVLDDLYRRWGERQEEVFCELDLVRFLQ